jgi:hypothetical protein
MANEDIATGKNARLEDDDFVIDPSKMKRKSDIPSMAPPPVMAPPPAMTPPPSFAPPPAAVSPPPMMMASSGTTTNTNSTQTTVNTADLAALAGNSQPSVIEEHWAKSFWRPAMGWLYMIICFMDFVAFPAISMFMPIIIKGMPYLAWQSLTLSNGGLIHMAFGAILGVAAYGRTQEKVASKQ